MNPPRKELIENFFKKASVVVMIDKTPAVEVSCKKGEIVIDVKNPLLLMGLGLDLNMIKKKDEKRSVIRKAIKEMGFKLKLRYKFFEIDL
jgi:hypothetical protein